MDTDTSSKKVTTSNVLKDLQIDRRFALLDLALLASGILLIFIDGTIFFFHLIFLLLTAGAFFWRFRAFAIRTLIWATLAIAVLLLKVLAGGVSAEELTEIPLLTIILLLVFAIARQWAKTKEALRSERDTLNTIMENTRAHLAYLDPEFNFVRVNSTYVKGCGHSREELLGHNHFDLFPNPENQALFERVRDTGQPVEFHAKPFEFPDQPERGITYWDWTLATVTNEDGQVEGLVLSLLDVTDRKQADNTLRQALQEARQHEAEISALLEGSRAVLAHSDFETAARSIFDSCKHLIGATAGYVALLTEDGTENEVLFVDSGSAPCTVDPTLPMPARGLREETYRSGKIAYENDFPDSEWTRFLPEGHASLDNVLFAPLVVKGITVGLLGLANKPGGFTENDGRLASAFGELAAIALFNSRTMESLRNSEERFRSVAQTAGEAIITIDSRGNIVFWNKAATTIFGYTPDETIGKPLTFIIPERFHSAHQNGMERVVSTGKSHILGNTVEMVGLRRDGSEFPFELSLSTWKIKEEMFFTGLIKDITQRKQAEEERDLLFAHTVDLISIIGFNRKFRQVNPAWHKTLGWSEEELLDMTYLELIHPDDLEATLSASKRARDAGKLVIAFQNRYRCKDGSYRWLSWNATPLPDRQLTFSIARDITEQKRAEEALQELAHDLGERVKELNCLYGIAALVEEPGISLAEILQGTVDLIPPGWQYPEITGARVILEGQEFRTKNFRETALWQQMADIIVGGRRSGTVEVCYLEERPEIDEGPFLREERSLLNAIAGRLGKITEQVRAEALLREQNQFIVTVFESLRHPFYVIDTEDYTLKMANSAAYSGGLPEAVTCYALTHRREIPCGDAGHLCPLKEIKKTRKPVVVEHTHYDGDGPPRVFEVHGHPIFDNEGKVIQLIEYTLDVTERKQAEEALHESQERWRSLAESSPDHILTLDTDLNIQFANYASPGLTVEELIDTPIDSYVEEKRQPEIRAILDKVLKTKEPASYETEYHGSDETIYYESRAVPRILDGEVVGLTLTARDITKRVRGEEALRERSNELSTLLEISRHVALTLELEPLLDLILDHLKAVVDYDGATISSLEKGVLTPLAYRGPIPSGDVSQLHLSMENSLIGDQVILGQEPVIIPDVRDDTPLARDFREVSGERFETVYGQIRSWMGVPLMIKDRMMGVLALQHNEPDHYYSPRQTDLVLAFANQAAVAIENARLYEQAQTFAAIEERQRLARDLHDAVSQTLFSASLSAEVLPRLWESNPIEGRRCLEEVHQLTRSALTEMRTLLLELRPEALVETELSDLLSQLTEAISSRARLPVTLAADQLGPVPSDLQVALYRISQEALNNVVKHAKASRAEVRLQSAPPSLPESGGEQRERLELRISDDGCGFDPECVPPDSLGLGIMHERAIAVGAELRIESQIGHGTQVVVIWPEAQRGRQ